ncbi:MAG: tetratricopeptide repeat protein [Burkholderiaceae bacterium]|nr:tetratricopeptide repeat protein [Burkholderiaceae bacterium]
MTASLFAVAAHATDIDEVNQLLKSGKQTQALVKVEQSLSSKPRDPQLRFLKGVIQTELGKPNDAIGTFTKLTEDFPELPEPYNNLAVLYASSAQFDKARAALEMAIRTNPSYSTAHENLGDIYANLASQAYSKALQLGGSSTTLQPKLTLIRELFSPAAKVQNPVAAKATPVAPVATVTPAPVVKAPTTPAPAVAPVVAANVTPTPPAAVPAVVGANNDGNKQIDQAVQAWATAWSSKNMNAYLASYAKGFVPPKSQSRSAWEGERRERIMGKSRISVKVNNLKTTVNGTTATVKFRQDYAADALATSSLKTLELTKVGDRWLIAKESTGG